MSTKKRKEKGNRDLEEVEKRSQAEILWWVFKIAKEQNIRKKGNTSTTNKY